MNSTMRLENQSDTRFRSACCTAVASALALTLTVGCSSKNYVRSQTAPLIQQTNDLDAKTAADHRAIADTDERAQQGISGAHDRCRTVPTSMLSRLGSRLMRRTSRRRKLITGPTVWLE